VHENTLVTIGY